MINRDGALGPRDSVAVPVTPGVGRRGAEDAVAGEALSDGVKAGAGQELLEDPLHYWLGGGVGLEPVQAGAQGRLARIGVGAGVGESVAVRWAAAEIAAFELGLRRHGGADADLDPVPFALAHAAEDAHDQVVGFVVRVERAADLGDPELDSIVDEQRVGQAELVAVERALRFADDDSVEAAFGLSESLE
jgi:hypothetical protein